MIALTGQPSQPQVKYGGNLPSGVNYQELNKVLHDGIPIVNSSVRTINATYPPVALPKDYTFTPPRPNYGRPSNPLIRPQGHLFISPVFKSGNDTLVQAFKNAIQPTPQKTPAGKLIWL